jgi:hypothetical protein
VRYLSLLKHPKLTYKQALLHSTHQCVLILVFWYMNDCQWPCIILLSVIQYSVYMVNYLRHSAVFNIWFETSLYPTTFRHLVSLTNLKPVNPVPAWNITPSRKGPSYSRPEQYPGEMGLYTL